MALAEGLALAPDAYVALSGGKDSLVALALASERRPGIAALWTDDELEYAETPATTRGIAERCGASLVMKTGTQAHGGWFRPWTSDDPWRHPEVGCHITRERARTFMAARGHDGVILGLRAEEAPRRQLTARAHGLVHQGADGWVSIRPLLWWSVADVWAAIAARELPYHPVYDTLARIGVPREAQRVGPLPLTPGWILRDGWPELHRRLIARYGARW